MPTHALALTVAFTYPQCSEPPPPSVPVGVVHDGDNALGVCVCFGCGARLPARVLEDMCEACARVRPPPMVVQKCVPRRATERASHRPRESLDVVRAVSCLLDTRIVHIWEEEKAQVCPRFSCCRETLPRTIWPRRRERMSRMNVRLI